jgi:predicted nuclease of predicted toxin-antitoxin system
VGAENHGVKPLDFPLLTDENIVPEVVQGLRLRGCNVRSASDEDLLGRRDADLLEHATSQRRVIVTHDLAFGRDAIRAGTPFVGIIYVRPGHISAGFVLAVMDALQTSSVEVEPPFVAVAERQESTVRVRVRTAPPW